MKKLFLVLGILFAVSFVFAEETVLLDTGVKAELEGYDYISNFEAISDSGYFKSEDLEIITNEDGIAVRVDKVPQYISTNYKIVPAYSSFLNDANTGAGHISNAGAIKSISITYRVNRSYDELFLLYSVSPMGPVKKIKIPQDFNSTQSMVFQTIEYTLPDYISDVTKRDIKSFPVIGSPANGIYFRGIQVQTNMPTGYMAYGPTSIVQIKEVKVVYDNAKTQEQLDAEKTYNELFEKDEQKPVRDKETQRIQERNRIREHNAALMDKDEADAK